MKPATPKTERLTATPLPKADSGGDPVPLEATNPITGTRFSRKRFLGLLGTSVGTCALPGGLSAKEPDRQRTLPPVIKNRKTRIVFRYFLPWAPAWGDQNFANQELDALIRFGHAAAIDSFQIFVNTYRHSYGAVPVDVESQQVRIDWMRELVAPRIRAEGFGFELNIQELLGALTFGTDLRAIYKWKQFMVDHYGVTSTGSPCPEDPVFREKMGKMLRAWAAIRPDIFWIDDDFRLHNHSTAGMFCYCPLHLKQFAQRAGREFTRAEILSAVLQPGPPSAFRQQWLDFLGDGMAELAQWIAQQVHSQSPETRVALMTSGTDCHSLEGRDWKKVLGNFAGKHQPLIRPTFGIYSGNALPPKAASVELANLIAQIQVLEQALGENNCEFYPELETSRYTTWAKSVAHCTYELLLGQLMGLPVITTSLCACDGSPLAEEPTLVPLLRNARPRMEALAALNLKGWPVQGLVALSDKDIARKTQVAAKADYYDMAPAARLGPVLFPLGIPFNFMTAAKAAASGEVVLLEAATIWNASNAELEQILSGQVLLTSGAARIVAARGFAELIGVRVNQHRTQGVLSEEHLAHQLPGVTPLIEPHYGFDWDELERLDPRVEIASYFLDSLGEKNIGTALFQNARGGRVAIYAQNSDMSVFGSHARLRWLHGVLLWLSRGQIKALPVIPHHGVSLLKKNRGQYLYSYANLGTDILTTFHLRWQNARAIRSIARLQPNGRWQRVKYTVTPGTDGCPPQIVLETNLNCYEWLVLLINETTA